MFRELKKRMKNEKGLTLIELLAVIVILAIISAIAIPAIGNIVENSRYKAAKSDAISVLSAANIYFTDKATETSVTVAELKKSRYLENAGTFDAIADTGKVTKASDGNKLEGTVKFSGDKTIEFDNATLTAINADKEDGSGDRIIPATP